MFQVIIVVFKGGTGIVGRVYVNALYLSGVKREQRFECFKVVALHNEVASVSIAVTMFFIFD
jgi:hypothetical protein